MRATTTTTTTTTTMSRLARVRRRFVRWQSPARVERLRALRMLPLDLRMRIESLVLALEWDGMKRMHQTRKGRRRDLLCELKKLQCEPREDSKLCEAFVDGSLAWDEPTAWTAKSVARRMAEMKYVHQHCKAFNKERNNKKNAIAKKYASYTRFNSANDDFNSNWYGAQLKESFRFGLTREVETRLLKARACKEVTGFRSFGAYVHDLAGNWKDFPDRWPWIKGNHSDSQSQIDRVTKQINELLLRKADDDDEDDDDEDDEDDEDEDDEDDDDDYLDFGGLRYFIIHEDDVNERDDDYFYDDDDDDDDDEDLAWYEDSDDY